VINHVHAERQVAEQTPWPLKPWLPPHGVSILTTETVMST